MSALHEVNRRPDKDSRKLIDAGHIQPIDRKNIEGGLTALLRVI